MDADMSSRGGPAKQKRILPDNTAYLCRGSYGPCGMVPKVYGRVVGWSWLVGGGRLRYLEGSKNQGHLTRTQNTRIPCMRTL